METSRKLKIGELLVREGFLAPKQLEKALEHQKTLEEYTPLGVVCVELGYFPKADLLKILSQFMKSIQLGELLTNLGLVTEKQIEQGLEFQKKDGKKKRLGKILVEMGFLSPIALVNALSMQLGVPKIVPDPALVDKSLLKKLNQGFLTRNEVFPAFKEGDMLTMIMADPLNEEAIRNLETFFGCKIQPAIASVEDIHQAITDYFQKKDSKENGSGSDPAASHKDLIIGQTDLSQGGQGDNIIDVVNYIISSGIQEKASDIHIEPLDTILRVRYRIDGVLQHKTDLPISMAPNLISRIKILCGLNIVEKRRHQDGRIEARVHGKEIDLRVSTYVAVYGESVVIRILHRETTLKDLDSLGFSPVNRRKYEELLGDASGIILLTGPTGSGKSTAVYASLLYLNRQDRKIITVEDPVECMIPGVVQGKLDPKLGLSHSDFLKSMMRQDPDVLMVGEIRDREAAMAVIEASLTGHKVFSTFHTDDTLGALLRLMDMGIEPFMISSTVVAVVSQRLVRVLCADCRKPFVPPSELLAAFEIAPLSYSDDFTFFQPKGCSKCKGSGYSGRTTIHELLAMNDSVRRCIQGRKSSSEFRRIARDEANLISMREDGFYKATKGTTSLQEVLRVVFHSERDQLPLRSASEVVGLCEGRKPALAT